MDTLRDFPAFRDLMDDLSAALRDGFKASDATVRSYFDALKDVSIGEIRANVKRIIATATKDTAFPRPASLRNRLPTHLPSAPDPLREKAERESLRSWRELRAHDPVEFEIRFRAARAFYELAQSDAADPGHDEWLREYRRWHALEYAPREQQEAAVGKRSARIGVAANDPDFGTEAQNKTGAGRS